jgi:ABC-2 type transport system permease protein
MLRRVLLIARRDYLQTVCSKGFLVGLILLPVIFGGGFLLTALGSKGNTKDQRVVVIDRTGVSAAHVMKSCEEANRKAMFNAATGLQVTPRYVFEEARRETGGNAQLLALSDRIRAGELFMVLDISAEALRPPTDSAKDLVRYYSNSVRQNQLGLWFPAAVNNGLRRARLAQLGVEAAQITEATRDVGVASMNLFTRDPATGKIIPAETRSPLQAEIVPLFLAALMILIVMGGSAPHLGAVAEDKAQRVFEMLLCSATPFELMMGKVLAALGACLTSSVFYILGGLLALTGMASFGLAPLHLLPWFFVYLIADVLMVSAIGVALGSACGTAQDAQSLAFILFLPIVIPIFLLVPVMQQPHGPFATAMAFIPPFTPVVMMMRQALPGGVPWWQPWLGLAGMAVYAAAVIWAASRIFRIGILSQGRAPKLTELAQWVLRG